MCGEEAGTGAWQVHGEGKHGEAHRISLTTTTLHIMDMNIQSLGLQTPPEKMVGGGLGGLTTF